MKKFNKVKIFREFNENFNISDAIDSKFELIGADMDEILDAINIINESYKYKAAKLKPVDWSLLTICI